EMLKLRWLVDLCARGAADAQSAGGLCFLAVLFEKPRGRGGTAGTALTGKRLLAVAKVFQNEGPQASLVVAVSDRAPQLPWSGGAARRPLARADAQGLRRRGVEQVNAAPLKDRAVSETAFGGKRAERPPHLRVAQPELRGDGLEVELGLF